MELSMLHTIMHKYIHHNSILYTVILEKVVESCHIKTSILKFHIHPYCTPTDDSYKWTNVLKPIS